jgi:phage nucleotide-binding protein
MNATTIESPLAEFDVTTPDQIEYLNLLVYGEFGVGKTYLCGTAQDHPMTSPILLLDVEGGTVTLRRRKDIHVVQLRSLRQIEKLHEKLRVNNNGYYKTVVIDSLTELADLDMREVMRKMYRDRPDRDPDVADKREWGIVRTHMRRIVRAFKDLPMNTIMTALLLQDKDDITGKTTFYPSLSGKMRTEVPGFFDVVGYMSSQIKEEETIRRIQFLKTEKVTAKDRTSSFGAYLENPTVPMMFEMLHNTNEKGK